MRHGNYNDCNTRLLHLTTAVSAGFLQREAEQNRQRGEGELGVKEKVRPPGDGKAATHGRNTKGQRIAGYNENLHDDGKGGEARKEEEENRRGFAVLALASRYQLRTIQPYRLTAGHNCCLGVSPFCLEADVSRKSRVVGWASEPRHRTTC